jgi:hypothetical protein
VVRKGEHRRGVLRVVDHPIVTGRLPRLGGVRSGGELLGAASDGGGYGPLRGTRDARGLVAAYGGGELGELRGIVGDRATTGELSHLVPGVRA